MAVSKITQAVDAVDIISKMNEIIDNLFNIDLVYPVGSIYMSVNATSPVTLFGGKWEAMPAGRVLLAQGTSTWGTAYGAGTTGGEPTHTLTVGELPSHNHSAWSDSQGGHNHTVSSYQSTGSINGNNYPNYLIGTTDRKTSWNGSHSHTITVGNKGDGGSHNIMQPYYSCYIWRRTA